MDNTAVSISNPATLLAGVRGMLDNRLIDDSNVSSDSQMFSLAEFARLKNRNLKYGMDDEEFINAFNVLQASPFKSVSITDLATHLVDTASPFDDAGCDYSRMGDFAHMFEKGRSIAVYSHKGAFLVDARLKDTGNSCSVVVRLKNNVFGAKVGGDDIEVTLMRAVGVNSIGQGDSYCIEKSVGGLKLITDSSAMHNVDPEGMCDFMDSVVETVDRFISGLVGGNHQKEMVTDTISMHELGSAPFELPFATILDHTRHKFYSFEDSNDKIVDIQECVYQASKMRTGSSVAAVAATVALEKYVVHLCTNKQPLTAGDVLADLVTRWSIDEKVYSRKIRALAAHVLNEINFI